MKFWLQHFDITFVNNVKIYSPTIACVETEKEGEGPQQSLDLAMLTGLCLDRVSN